ncbi:MAG: response regulator [Clostridia bacterium]
MAKKLIASALACALLLLFLSGAGLAISERPATCRTVRVGYFDFPGYHDRAPDGRKSGYGYEYLQEIRKYANWQYTYVFSSYAQCLADLAEGKIDLMTSVSYAPERDASLDYSETPMGTKSTILTVKDTDRRYAAGEYTSFDGMRVGMLPGNTSNDHFDAFSQTRHFSYVRDDQYHDVQALWQALQDGAVDAIITSNLRKPDRERVIAEFSPTPHYAVVKAGNTQLLYELNMALEKVRIATPTYQSALYQKYYGAGSAGDIVLSSSEQAYIRDHPNLNVLIAPSLAPLVSLEKGRPEGIVPDFLAKMLAPSGLTLHMTVAQDARDYRAKLADSETYPVLGMVEEDLYNAEVNHLRLTSPYLTLNYNVITQVGTTNQPVVIAAVKGKNVTKDYIATHYAPEQIKYFETYADCVTAVLQGEATRTIMNSYNAERVIENDMRDRLVSNTIMGFQTSLALSAHGGADDRLFSILNKCVNALSPDDARTILLKNTLYRDRQITLIEYLYMYPMQVVLALSLFFAIVLAVVVLATRQHRLEQERRTLKETAHFAKIAMGAHGRIVEVNMDDLSVLSYSFVNKQLVKQPNGASADVLGERSRRELIYPAHIAQYDRFFSRESLLSLAGTDLQKTCTLQVKTPDDAYRWTLFTLQGIPSDMAHPNNLMIFEKNIEELKRAEVLRQQQLTDALNTAMAASAAKGTFMSRMSHEIRTPLNAVIGYMTIAKSSDQSLSKVNDCIVKAEFAAKHLLSIINDVLDMSSIESGKLKMAHVPFDFRELISGLASVFYNQAQAKDVAFEVINHHVSEDFLIGDKLRLNQILLNLLSNAIKFTPSGGAIYFTVEQTAIKEGTVFMRFIVADNGIGMTKEFEARLFSPFEQQDATISQHYGGTGLGLSITKNLVTMMNGAITAKSAPGKGATFTVELPFDRDPSGALKRQDAQNFSHVRALIVDDEKSACEYMEILMQRCGVKSECVLSGTAAVERIAQAHHSDQPFDLCLMDWKMPDMDGVETVRKIRECVGNDMPIIVVTAYDFAEIEDPAKAAGVNLFISKPLFQSTLFDLLVNTYGRYKAAHPQAQDSACDFAGARLLLAEDNEMNREIATDILTQYGFAVTCARDGKEAVDAFEASAAGDYAAILMDIQMPVMDGHAATRAIRASKHPSAKTIPVIAMTANAFSEDIAASHASGMNDHISKPIDVAQMLAILKKFID